MQLQQLLLHRCPRPQPHFVHRALQSMMYRYPPQHHEESAAFHQPAAKLPGGQVLEPLLTVQQKTVQPLAALVAGPHTVA
ncbi:hypothetical protein BJY21_002641 [Kineosphaera limosa]|uniref:hypothetical protein n=1 Tax=Kineosphaera limosa TaxID=111564 RepID=UPI00068AF1DB|nr:hypothetical protein [Kineosphaera limosa]NYE01457.1 hypothetical protein [Kineosphaera limosa]